MDIADSYALQTGSAPLGTGAAAKLTVRDLGNLRVPSGKVGAGEPFLPLGCAGSAWGLPVPDPPKRNWLARLLGR